MCCPFIMLGQLYEKIVGPRGQCMKITIILFVVTMMQVPTVGAGFHSSWLSDRRPSVRPLADMLVYFRSITVAVSKYHHPVSTPSCFHIPIPSR